MILPDLTPPAWCSPEAERVLASELRDETVVLAVYLVALRLVRVRVRVRVRFGLRFGLGSG